jgi:DNA polymerase type B, organellar and viral
MGIDDCLGSMKNIYWDTEDNSPLIQAAVEAGKRPPKRKVTQIAAMDEDGEVFHNRGDVKEFLRWLRFQGDCCAWALNAAYDMGNIGANRLDEFDMMLVGGRLIRAEWKNVEFRDVYNIWRSSVKDLGEAFGLKKGKLNIHSKKYALRDVEIIKKAMEFVFEMLARRGVDRIPCTLGSLAIKAWKASGGRNWHDDSEFSHRALFGGRVELFQRRVKRACHYVDINSLYPFAMTKAFPTACDDLRGSLEGYGIAAVDITVPEMFAAPLPCRMGDDRVVFPFGKLTGVWTLHEIRNAVEVGCKVTKVHASVGSEEGEYYYRDFILEMYKLRKESKSEPHRLFYKLLMNNLYGQLGMSGSVTKTGELSNPDIGGKIFGNKVLYDCALPLAQHVNYMHAAYITSYGRLELYKYLRELGERVVYCDTDSVIFTGRQTVKTGKELGEMKYEGGSEHGCETFAPKCYIFDDEAKAKGVPRGKADEYIRKKIVTYWTPYKIREAVAFYDRENARPLSTWRPVEKEFRAVYDKKTLKGERYFPKNACNLELGE